MSDVGKNTYEVLYSYKKEVRTFYTRGHSIVIERLCNTKNKHNAKDLTIQMSNMPKKEKK